MRILVVALFLFAALLLYRSEPPAREIIPRCPEDAVLVGVGDFHKGRWTGYECGPARDDYGDVHRHDVPGVRLVPGKVRGE